MNGINDSFSHGLGGDTLAEYYFNKVKQKTKEDYFPPLNSEDLIGDGDSVGDDEEEPAHDYSLDYLTFVALEDGTFSFSGSNISYSLDNGETWVSLPNNTATPTVSAGSEILWKGNNTTIQMYRGIGTFNSTNNYEIKGNVLSVIHGDDFLEQTELPVGFYNLQGLGLFSNPFGDNDKLISAENLYLPTNLTAWCYDSLFYRCTSLITPPQLPATTLVEGCYSFMFYGCTSLTSAPELPATTLAENCYNSMFQGCTSLTSAPELPATTLANNCYSYMFGGCTSLETAPELPATTLVKECYSGMFSGCTNLSYIKAMFMEIYRNMNEIIGTFNWVQNVAASGTFVKNSAATWNTSGNNGIPSGWTVETADE